MTTATDQDTEQKLRAVAHAIAQQSLEGLTVTPATVAGLQRAARGEVETDELIRNIRLRVQNGSLLRK